MLKANVLLVESDQKAISVYRDFFQELQIKVLLSSNAEDAWKLFKKIHENISLVLIDDNDGTRSVWGLIKNIREISLVPIILMSTRMEAFQVLSKPFKPSELKKLILKQLF